LQGNGRRGEAYSSRTSPGKKLDDRNERWFEKERIGKRGTIFESVGTEDSRSVHVTRWGQVVTAFFIVNFVDFIVEHGWKHLDKR
jgi:hypothetical protein